MVIQIALDQTLLAHNHTKGLGSKCKDRREKGAWADCMTLFESTIFELNRTLNPTKKNCNEFDKQTWLSTALTNLETCIAGFKPYISNNVTKLISNSLAMHNNIVPRIQSYKLGFPTWVTRRDRKLLQASKLATANLVVAQDGSGDFKIIREALDATAKKTRSGRFVIHIKSGVYAEYLVIGTNLRNIMLVGDGMQSTIITGDRSYGNGFTIFNSATVAVMGDGFIARGITFRNTAGPQNKQAVALRVGSDHSVFHQCSFEGYQDTLFAHSQRQFYRECNIYAQGRTDPNQNTGIIIQYSRITASPDLKPVIASFLGRPWEQYSRTVVVESFIDSLISPVGWLQWDGNFALDTLFYAEYNNFGPGSLTSKRVKWKGYKIITNVDQISQFFVGNFIGGESWIPDASVPFTYGI
uniref:Pectinesterase inhibitor domain-containing protein n=1 Tax=Chenopodium quinoa TaxID=63459 RepID=A0A803LML0_CHEQI